MQRQRFNVSRLLFFCPQEKKVFAKTEKKRILYSKGSGHFRAKNRNLFFRFHFFQNALSCEWKWLHQATPTDVPNLKNDHNFLANFSVYVESAKYVWKSNLVIFVGLRDYPSMGPSQMINQVLTFRWVPCTKLFSEQSRYWQKNKIPHRTIKLTCQNHFLIKWELDRGWNWHQMN